MSIVKLRDDMKNENHQLPLPSNPSSHPPTHPRKQQQQQQQQTNKQLNLQTTTKSTSKRVPTTYTILPTYLCLLSVHRGSLLWSVLYGKLQHRV